MNAESSDFIAVGRVVGVFGYDGWLKVTIYSMKKDRFQGVKVIYINRGSGFEGKIISDQKIHGKHNLLKLNGIENREEGRDFIAEELFLPEKEKIQLPPDSYFVHDVIGLNVFDEEDKFIGQVKDVISSGATDIYLIRKNDLEILVPANAEFIREVDLQNGKMVVRLWEEL
ncbi:MAG: 16S rRNA processing protein RimM [Calditrichaeota bacterium]|nr:16S rRNA processing protein RimM [Calditrichota bacterium]RQW05305.1 MAG: 16S rRNA processing protein RimM [Calditrichota bacterium]